MEGKIMKKVFLALFLLIPALVSGQNQSTMTKKYANQLPQEGRGNSKVAYLGRSIDQMIYDFMEQKGIPGMTLAIVQAPYIPRVAGYGVTNLDEGRLAAVKTLWPAGQISQGFNAVAIMQLYEKGKLDIKDKASKYLKNLPEAWNEITIFELLQHSAGIPDYRMQADYDSSKAYTPEELIATVGNLPLEFEPGTDVKQSATNFLVLAQIVEKAGKMSYHDFVTKNQIEFLGLKQTVFGEDLPKVKQENVAATGNVHQSFKSDKDYISPSETATGYREVDGELKQMPANNSSALKGFADIWASAENISHWDIGLAGSTLISKPENRALIYKPTTLKNGKVVPAMAGWQFQHHKGLMDIKGSIPGFSAFLSRFTDASELVCVTLLANKEGVDLSPLARDIAAAFDPKNLGSGANDNELSTYESVYSVDETMAKVEQTLKGMGIPVFAKFDHGKNAEEAGLKMLPAQVIVFGSPKVGTNLMIANPSISIELPLKIAVWEDSKGSVWVEFPDMAQLAARYGMQGNPIIGNMQTLLEKIVSKAANVY